VTEPSPAPPPRRAKRLAIELAIALVVVVVVRTFVVEAFVVRGPSMDPTLTDGDRLLIWKATRAFKRGDLVVFAHPHDGSRALVKRVVAVPGEKVELRAGRVFVDDRELGETYLRDEARSPSIARPPETVPPGCYYVLGDNRMNSQDSRNFGPIEDDRIVGRALFVAWPPRSIR
jgi:signal peptidase I